MTLDEFMQAWDGCSDFAVYAHGPFGPLGKCIIDTRTIGHFVTEADFPDTIGPYHDWKVVSWNILRDSILPCLHIIIEED